MEGYVSFFRKLVIILRWGRKHLDLSKAFLSVNIGHTIHTPYRFHKEYLRKESSFVYISLIKISGVSRGIGPLTRGNESCFSPNRSCKLKESKEEDSKTMWRKRSDRSNNWPLKWSVTHRFSNILERKGRSTPSVRILMLTIEMSARSITNTEVPSLIKTDGWLEANQVYWAYYYVTYWD